MKGTNENERENRPRETTIRPSLAQDAFAVLSQAKCIAALDAGKFKDEIVPAAEFAIVKRAAMGEANQITIVSRR